MLCILRGTFGALNECTLIPPSPDLDKEIKKKRKMDGRQVLNAIYKQQDLHHVHQNVTSKVNS